MSTFYRLILALVIIAFTTVGCQTSATPTITPATNTPVSPTSPPISATAAPAPTASVTATQPLGDNGAGLIAFLSDRDGKPAIYVMNADGSNQRRLAGGKPKDTCLRPVWSPDGQRIAYMVVPNGLSGDRHGPLEIWSVGLDGAAPIELSAGVTDTLLAYPWNDPTWSPDGTRLAVAALHPVAGTSDKRSVVTILRSDGSGVEQAFPLDWIAGAVEWASNGKQILIEDISPDESVRTHNVHVLSISNGEIREVYRDLLSAAWSPDGTEIVVVPTQSGQVLIVKLDGTSRPVGPLPAGTTPELAVWSPDGTAITVFGKTKNGDEASLYLVTISTGQVRRTTLVAEYLEGLEYSPDGKQLLVSTGHPGRSSHSNRWPKSTLWVYDLASATLTALTDGKGYDAAGVWAPAPTASTGITAATVSQVKLQTKLIGHTGRLFSVAFSADSRLLASAGQNNEVKLWSLITQQEIKSFNHNGGGEVFFLANDQQLALSNGEVWNIESGEIVHAAATNHSECTFSSDGRWMALVPSNLPIELWNTATWQIERTLDKHSDAVIGMAFSADSSLLATGSALGPDDIADISIKLWDVAGGRELFTLESHRTDIHAVAFSPDGSLLVSGGIDPTVKIWDVKSGQLIRSLQSGEGVMDVIFSPDGTLVASAGSDGTVKLWDATTGKLLKTLVHPDELMTVAFSPDGTLLVSGSYDNLIYLWGISK